MFTSKLVFILLIGCVPAINPPPQNEDKSSTEEIFTNVKLKVIHNLKGKERSSENTGLELLKKYIQSCKPEVEFQTVIVESEDDGDMLTEEMELSVIFNCENLPNDNMSESPFRRILDLFRRYSNYIFVFIVTWHARDIYTNIMEIFEPPEQQAHRALLRQYRRA